MCLLRIRGAESAGWDTLYESAFLRNDIVSLASIPLRGETQIRLILLLYAHILEMKDAYSVMGNMLRIARGDRYSMALFSQEFFAHLKIKWESKYKTPKGKIELISSWASELGLGDVSAMFDSFFDEDVRNAFAHSNYTLHEGSFHVVRRKNGFPFKIDITKDLVPKINHAIVFMDSFLNTLQQSQRSYAEPKILPSRFSPIEGIELDVRPDVGVVGFHSPPKNGPCISYKGSSNEFKP